MYSYAEEQYPTLYMGCTLAPPGEYYERSVCGGDAVLCQVTLTTCSLCICSVP